MYWCLGCVWVVNFWFMFWVRGSDCERMVSRNSVIILFSLTIWKSYLCYKILMFYRIIVVDSVGFLNVYGFVCGFGKSDCGFLWIFFFWILNMYLWIVADRLMDVCGSLMDFDGLLLDSNGLLMNSGRCFMDSAGCIWLFCGRLMDSDWF